MIQSSTSYTEVSLKVDACSKLGIPLGEHHVSVVGSLTQMI